MAKFILGRKLNMTQKFQEDGRVVPVTVVEAGPCTVVQVKNNDKDGYNAVQVGYATKNKRGINKPLAGHLKKLDSFRYLKEFRLDNVENFERSKVFDVTSFAVGDNLKVTATSKGKGFQGVVKRHGFHGSPASHGHKDQLRMPGSIGATDAARVFKGTRMGGHMGDDKVTVKNLEIVEIKPEENILFIKGAVPGARNGILFISTAESNFEVENLKNMLKNEKEVEKVEEVIEKVIEEAGVKPEEKVEELTEEPKEEVKEGKVEDTKEDTKEEKAN